MGNRCGNSGDSVRLILVGSKITADGDCSHEIKRPLVLERKVMINLDSILKSGGSVVKNWPADAKDLSSILDLGRFPYAAEQLSL